MDTVALGCHSTVVIPESTVPESWSGLVRNKIAQVHALHAQADPSKAAQIPLPWVQAALKAQLQANPTPGAFDQVALIACWADRVACLCQWCFTGM